MLPPASATCKHFAQMNMESLAKQNHVHFFRLKFFALSHTPLPLTCFQSCLCFSLHCSFCTRRQTKQKNYNKLVPSSFFFSFMLVIYKKESQLILRHHATTYYLFNGCFFGAILQLKWQQQIQDGIFADLRNTRSWPIAFAAHYCITQ